MGRLHPMLSLLEENKSISIRATWLPPSGLPFWAYSLVQSLCRRAKCQFAPANRHQQSLPTPRASTSPCCTVQDGCPLLPLPAFPSLQQLTEKWLRSSAFFCHKLPCPVFYIFPLLSSFYYLPYFLVLCNYVLGHQTVKQGLLLKAFIISFSIVSSNTSSGFRLTFFCSPPPEHMVVNMQHAVSFTWSLLTIYLQCK